MIEARSWSIVAGAAATGGSVAGQSSTVAATPAGALTPPATTTERTVGLVARAGSQMDASVSSVSSAVARASLSMYASLSSLVDGLIGMKTAPIRRIPSTPATNSTRFSRKSATRSPRTTPCCESSAETRAARRASSA